MNSFGWLPPTPEKQEDNDRYQVRSLRYKAPAVVEKSFSYNPSWVDEMDQGNIGACVGYSCSWMMSYYNSKLYNSYRLYKQAQKDDGDPNTSGDNDGAYLWSAGSVLKKRGHALYNTDTFLLEEGVASYYWAKTVDEIRVACDLNRPPVFGIPWFSSFSSPSGGWIGENSSWGSILGGHAIWLQACSDSKVGPKGNRGAVALLNTWGKGWNGGNPVWISYKSIERLFTYQSECMVVLDRSLTPVPTSASASASPSIVPPDEDKIVIPGMEIIWPDGTTKTYAGELERVK